MTRKLRSILPVVSDELKPNVPTKVRELMKAEREREKQKEYYDRHTKPLPPLSVGDSIRYQEGKNFYQKRKERDHTQSRTQREQCTGEIDNT